MEKVVLRETYTRRTWKYLSKFSKSFPLGRSSFLYDIGIEIAICRQNREEHEFIRTAEYKSAAGLTPVERIQESALLFLSKFLPGKGSNKKYRFRKSHSCYLNVL